MMLTEMILYPRRQLCRFSRQLANCLAVIMAALLSMPVHAEALNPLASAASQWGASQCSQRIQQISNFVGFSDQDGALAMMPAADTDRSLLPLAMEISTRNGAAYVSASFAPGQANGCGASYDAVLYWENNCQQVASGQFAAYPSVGKLGRDITMLDGGMATKVFLMPAGNGCVSIKKERVL